jgi:four helix bundle protein
MPIRQFEELEVWRVAKDLAIRIYKVTASGAFSRDFGLRDQIRRAAVSAMSNIAEGFDRYSRKEFRQFLSIARGSASEVRSQLHLAYELSYVSKSDFDDLVEICWRVTRMLGALRDKLGATR